MSDLSDVRAGLATVGAGVAGVRESTSTALSGVGMLPAIKVTHVASIRTIERGAGYELREVTIKGHLLVAKPGDVGRAEDKVEQYAEALTVAHRSGILLGLATYVQDSSLEAWEFASITYGGIEYAGADLTWRIVIREAVTRTA